MTIRILFIELDEQVEPEIRELRSHSWPALMRNSSMTWRSTSSGTTNLCHQSWINTQLPELNRGLCLTISHVESKLFMPVE